MIELLRDKQRIIYYTLKKYIDEKGYPPSVREICDIVGLKSTSTVHSHLTRLEKLGLIARDPTKPRAITIIENNETCECEANDVPVKESYLNYFPDVKESKLKEVLESLVFFKTSTAMYKNKGNTLSSIGIDNNDHVVVDLSKRSADESIVLAVVNDEFATVKRIFKNGDLVKLALDKNSLDCILADSNNVVVIGTIIGVLKDIS